MPVSDQGGWPQQDVSLSLLSGSVRVKWTNPDRKTPQISSLCLGCLGCLGVFANSLYTMHMRYIALPVCIKPTRTILSINILNNPDNPDNPDRARKSAGFSCLGYPDKPRQTLTNEQIRLASARPNRASAYPLAGVAATPSEPSPRHPDTHPHWSDQGVPLNSIGKGLDHNV
jgi:hypothetical protein